MTLDESETTKHDAASTVVLLQRLVLRAAFARYAMAAALAGLSIAARLALEPLWSLNLPLITFYPAIVASALLGGFGPGMTTTLLCAAAADYFWIPPVRSFAISEPGQMVAMILFVGIGALISAVNHAWRRATDAAAVANERLRTTVRSIGDAVIATDTDARITLMNPVAEALTAWKFADAAGRSLHEIFAIVNEDSGRPVDSPVDKVFREGTICGLANHTLLIAKDGRKIPIDDSAAPIGTADGHTVGAVLVFRDISERRRHEQTVDRLAAIVEASDDAILTKTLDGTITSWNDGAERMFGYSAADAIGRPITMLFPPDRIAEEEELLRRIGRGERVQHFETERINKDGCPVPVSVSLSPLKNAAGSIVGVSTIARDITQVVRLLTVERSARAEAERANRTKEQFLAVLSHELRQPLNTMLGWLRLLRSERVDSAQAARALEALDRSTQAQARMIDDLLDMARIESGKLTLQRESIKLAPLISEWVESLQQEATAKALKLESVAGPVFATVSADSDRLRQVVMNLVANAIKYTPSGGRIQVRMTGENGAIRIVVSDTGIGIDQELLPHVFERFRQADWRDAGTQGGLGLGLAIVRELVEMHDGTVAAQSDGPGRGATFTVTLPANGAG
jgi:PAS domain S-box-containing protein